MPNEWWTERMKRADDAFVRGDGDAAASVLQEMLDSSLRHADRGMGGREAMDLLESAITAAKRGELTSARLRYDRAIPVLGGA